MSEARTNILRRLSAGKPHFAAPAAATRVPLARWDVPGRIDQFRNKMESVRAEVHVTVRDRWPDLLKSLVTEKQLSNLLYAPNGPLGETLSQAWRKEDPSPLTCRNEAVDEWKEELFFNIGGAITAARWGIAETGSLVLWPTTEEPRSFSLVPPVHIAVLEAKDIYDTFADLVEQQNWHLCMPTNALLISGPSKTADIEQTLAYGVHGPIELIIIVIT